MEVNRSPFLPFNHVKTAHLETFVHFVQKIIQRRLGGVRVVDILLKRERLMETVNWRIQAKNKSNKGFNSFRGAITYHSYPCTNKGATCKRELL